MKKYLLSFVFGISIIGLFAQPIPNGGFETTANWQGSNISVVSSIPVVTTGGKATLYPVAGSKFLLVENSTTYGIGSVFNSFPFTGRPDTFSFHLGYMQGNLSERMGVAVILSKWDADSNKSDIVCQLSVMIPGTNGWITPWEVFNIPLNTSYKSSEKPDSAFILFQNDIYTNATLSTVMVVDEVKFSKQLPSGKTWVGISDHDLILNQVYYSSNRLYINYYGLENMNSSDFSIYNIAGQKVY